MREMSAENQANAASSPARGKSERNRISCNVQCLDGTELTVDLQKNAKGLDLMHRVIEKLNVQEKEYFGFLWKDKRGELYWLDNTKEIRQQLKGGNPVFTFSVKFYEPYPSQLKTDYTRYLLCLQIRNDLLSGRLPCSFANQAILGSYTVQSEIGDYEPQEHGPNYLEGIPFAPDQTPELLDKIRELHMSHRGLSPEESDMQFLRNASKLTMYGVDAHPAWDDKGQEVMLGVSHMGIMVFKERRIEIKIPWSKMKDISKKKSKFRIRHSPGEMESFMTTNNYKLPSEKACKRLYKSCIEHHTFFRLTFPDPPPSGTELLKMGSKFRYSDRTLHQLRKEGFNVKEQPRFSRVSSRNWSHRYNMHPVTEHRVTVDDAERPNRQAPTKPPRRPVVLAEEESVATMTKEERELYLKNMKEMKDDDYGAGYQVELSCKPGEEPEAMELKALPAEAGVTEATAYGVAAANPAADARVTPLTDEEREQRQREKFEREKELREQERLDWERRERDKHRPEVAGVTYKSGELPTASASFSAPRPKEEPEFVSVGVATPVSGETVKKAETLVAETDSYKGHVFRMSQPDMSKQPGSNPDITRTHTWGARARPDTEPKSRQYTTLPARGRMDPPRWPDDDRRRSADDLDEPRQKPGGVALVSREDLVRSYSPGGAHIDFGTPQHGTGSSEIRSSLREDVHLAHEPGERGFVRENIRRNEDSIKRQSGGLELEANPTEVHTKTMTITSEVNPTIIRQTAAPEVETSVMTISGPDGRREVTESFVPTRAADQESAVNGRWGRGGHDWRGDNRRQVPSVPTRTVVYDPNLRPASPSSRGTPDGVVSTQVVTMDGTHPHTRETVRHTVGPTEIITKEIIIQGDGEHLTAEELKDIIAKHGGGAAAEDIVTTTTYTTRTQTIEREVVTEAMRVVDDDGNIIKTGDPDTDAAIEEAVRRAREENPGAKITEIVITRTDDESSA